MTRTKDHTPARVSEAHALAAALLRVCANVFARSQIYFDASRRSATASGAPQTLLAALDESDDDDATVRPPLSRRAEPTIH
jgi:hypothetical protein